MTSASTIGTQQLDQRSGACDTAADKTIGTQQPDQHSGDWNTAADTKMEIMSNEVPKPDTQLDGA